jgi:hypothetical protein
METKPTNQQLSFNMYCHHCCNNHNMMQEDCIDSKKECPVYSKTNNAIYYYHNDTSY